MSDDISYILQNWNPSPKEKGYRKIKGEDGREKIQIRVHGCIVNNLETTFEGVLQMSLDGRPDDIRPHNRDFSLDYYIEKLEEYKKEHNDSEDGFVLDNESYEELFEESSKIYNRYVLLNLLDEQEKVVRDTERNMKLFRFVNRYAANEDDKINLEKWWPYILSLNGEAKASIYMNKKEYDLALLTIQETRKKIENLEEIDAKEFKFGKKRSKKFLENLEKIIMKSAPSGLNILNKKLDKAVKKENYEEAATIRDAIRKYIEILEKGYEKSVIEKQIEKHSPKED